MKSKELKIDFHIHSNTYEKIESDLNPKQIIDIYAKEGFDAIALTEHNQVNYNKSLRDYAKKKGILLIPGVEVTIKQGDVLIINCDEKEIKKRIGKRLPSNIEELRKIKTKNNLIIIPHPFMFYAGVGKRIFKKNKDIFDAVEFNGYMKYFWFFRWNKRAIKLAKECNKPLIGNSDSHLIFHYGETYSIVKAKKNIKDILDAVRKGNVKVKTKPNRNHFLVFLMLYKEIIKTIERFINYINKKKNNG